jgi:hypothetical protein
VIAASLHESCQDFAAAFFINEGCHAALSIPSRGSSRAHRHDESRCSFFIITTLMRGYLSRAKAMMTEKMLQACNAFQRCDDLESVLGLHDEKDVD